VITFFCAGGDCQVNEQTQKRAIIRACKILILILILVIATHHKLSATLCGFIIDLHLASVTSKHYSQQEAFPSVMKPSETGVLHYPWRAVDQDGDEIDILIQKSKDRNAAKRFLKRR
jgi:hypothetical protein